MSVSSTNRQRAGPDEAPAGHNGNGGGTVFGSVAAAESKTSPDAAAVSTGADMPITTDVAAKASTATGRHAPRIPGDPPDETLLANYRGGDRKAFALLVERYQRELFHFLVRFLNDRAAAEDVFQETFLQVHQSAEQFDLTRRFRPWLFTIAANKARDLMRSKSRRPTSPLQANINGGGDEEGGQLIDLMEAAEPLPGEAMEREEVQQLVQATIESMPEHLREILLLSYFHQFPYKEIGDILGIPLGTVKSRLHAAVAHFADRWKNRQRRTRGG